MTLDNENQRKMLEEMMDVVNFPGRAWKEVYDLRMAVVNASLTNLGDPAAGENHGRSCSS